MFTKKNNDEETNVEMKESKCKNFFSKVGTTIKEHPVKAIGIAAVTGIATVAGVHLLKRRDCEFYDLDCDEEEEFEELPEESTDEVN